MLLLDAPKPGQPDRCRRRQPMYFAAAVLVVLSGVFYAAGHHELGSYSSDVCRYGGAFCDNPPIGLFFARPAGVWGAFLRIRQDAPLRPRAEFPATVAPCPGLGR